MNTSLDSSATKATLKSFTYFHELVPTYSVKSNPLNIQGVTEKIKELLQNCKNCWYSDSDVDMNYESDDDIGKLLDDEKISPEDYLLVRFVTKTRLLYYLGKVEEVCENKEYVVKFLRKIHHGFCFPRKDDISVVSREDIMIRLPKPSAGAGTSRMSSFLQFM